MRFIIISALVSLSLSLCAGAQDRESALQPLADEPGQLADLGIYIPSTVSTIRWGSLPNRNSLPIINVPSGSIVIFDTVSHEGILEDQGRNPVDYFAGHGISSQGVLDDARTIASSNIEHDFISDGPHIVTGPVAIDGAEPGDTLKIEVISPCQESLMGLYQTAMARGLFQVSFLKTMALKLVLMLLIQRFITTFLCSQK